MSLFLLAALSSAPASEGHVGFGIYDVNPDLTTGNLEFFREIYVSPEAFPSQIDPVESTGEGFGTLENENKTTAWQLVHVNEVKVGVVGPLTTAKIHRMKEGSYTVSFEAPNGFIYEKSISTVEVGDFDPAEGGMLRTPDVAPVDMPVGDKPDELLELPEPEDKEPAPKKGAKARNSSGNMEMEGEADE